MNKCPLRNTEKCKKFLAKHNAVCDGTYFCYSEGISISVTNCDILNETYKKVN